MRLIVAPSIFDATAAVIRQMKQLGLGLFSDSLLSSEARTMYESILAGTRGKDAIAKAGSLLIQQVADPQFVSSFASGMVRDIEAVFWVELSEHLIRAPICKYKNFGVFSRYARKVSFDSDLLTSMIKLPTIYGASEESAVDALLAETAKTPTTPRTLEESAIDALCRTVMEQIGLSADLSRSFQAIAEGLLRDCLVEVLGTFSPPAADAMAAFSFASALSSYYAWAAAFGVAIQFGQIRVEGVGSFLLVGGRAGDRIDFTASESFLDLLEANARSAPLPEQRVA